VPVEDARDREHRWHGALAAPAQIRRIGAELVTIDTATLQPRSRRLLSGVSVAATHRTIARLKGDAAAALLADALRRQALAANSANGRRGGPPRNRCPEAGSSGRQVPRSTWSRTPRVAYSKGGRCRPANSACRVESACQVGSSSCCRAPFSRPLRHQGQMSSASDQVKRDESRVELGGIEPPRGRRRWRHERCRNW
jgi:hypothetical protein